MRLRESAARFFAGRNGTDALSLFLLALCALISVVSLLLRSSVGSGMVIVPITVILWVAELFLLGVIFFRTFSKNRPKRRAENEKFLALIGRLRAFFRLQYRRFADRKTHLYRSCPSCKKTLRLPKRKGEHEVCCPCCKTKFRIKG